MDSPAHKAVARVRNRLMGCASRDDAGFTLVEIMIVVVILGLLAAMALPAMQRVQNRARASRYANDFRQFDAAFQRFAMETGVFPPVAALGGAIPAGMTGYLPAAYTQPASMGGMYGWSGPSNYIIVQGGKETDAVMQSVDAILDDGDLSKGAFIKVAAIGYGFHVQ